MARGKYWEITHDPDHDDPTETVKLSDLEGVTGWDNRTIVGDGANPVTVRFRVSDPARHFERCNFTARVVDSNIANWHFNRCTFKGSKWENVKFSRCVFTECHFAEAMFHRCQFLESCKFVRISASAELFRITETAISASSFLSALTANLAYLPQNVSVEYQRHRLVGTKEKLAKLIYDSTKSEPNVDFYFEAFKELMLASLDEKVEKHRYQRSAATPTKNNYCRFILMSLPARIEREIVRLSGWFSDWGRSLVRPMIFFIAAVVLFSFVYYGLNFRCSANRVSERLLKSFIEAMNVTLVAGFTAHFDDSQDLPIQLVEMTNLLVGLFWYSLIVPVVTRKILR